MPSGSVKKRRDCYEKVCDNLARNMGLPNFGIHGMFHCIIWVGDLNYRLVDMEVSKCEEILYS